MFAIEPHIKGIIFDCDGTLVDSMPIHLDAWHRTLAEYDAPVPHDFLASLNGAPTHKIIETINETFNKNINMNNFTRDKENLARETFHTVQAIDPVVEVVKKYHQKLPMAVASGGSREFVMMSLNNTGLTNYFDAIVTADDDVEPKPSPKIFIKAAELIGIEPQFCQVFEDGDMGILAAQKAGMIVTDIREYIL